MTDHIRPALHFVGCWDDDEVFDRAVQVFGPPDFVHRKWDVRATADVAPGDTVVFFRDKDWTRFVDNAPVAFAFDDSAHF